MTAFRLRHGTGLIWPRIAEMFADGRPLADLLSDEVDDLRNQLDDVLGRLASSEDLLRDIKDSRNYITVDAESEATAA